MSWAWVTVGENLGNSETFTTLTAYTAVIVKRRSGVCLSGRRLCVRLGINRMGETGSC